MPREFFLNCVVFSVVAVLLVAVFAVLGWEALEIYKWLLRDAV